VSLDFWRAPTGLSDPGAQGKLFDDLPRDVAGLARVVQGLLVHEHMTDAYGVTLMPERRGESHIRPVDALLAAIAAHDPRPLTTTREPKDRHVCVCRSFTLLFVAVLRHQGVPARARCGFGLYFDGTPVDHWVVEYWDGAAWKLGDAQLDAVQRAALKLSFDPLDVPRDAFLVAGEAWRRCRAGEADPMTFGIMDMHGLWFVAGNLVRDIAALNNMEMLPWDVWGAMWEPGQEPAPETLAVLDAAAPLSLDPDPHFDEIRALYERPEWRVPARVFNAVAQRVDTV
jgi:hypothetical protein